MNPVMFTIFNIDVKWYSVLILVGILLALFLMEHESKRFDLDRDTIFNVVFYAVIFGIIGARLYYCLFNMSYYSNNLIEIFYIWNGGLAIHGGLIFGIITIYIYTKKHKLNFLKILDIAAPAVILAQAIGRWGNFFNSEAHGIAVSLSKLQSLPIPEFVINGMNIGGTYYLPTFYFESLWCLLGFIVLIIVRRFKFIKVGTITCLYLMWYSLGRVFIESYRTDSLMLGGFKMAQIVSIIMFIIGLVGIIIIYRQGKYSNLYNEKNSKNIKY